MGGAGVVVRRHYTYDIYIIFFSCLACLSVSYGWLRSCLLKPPRSTRAAAGADFSGWEGRGGREGEWAKELHSHIYIFHS